jgi:hypothetical protein
MPEKGLSGNCNSLKESVCIYVDRIYDCCKDRDCVTDVRVYLCDESQNILDRAINVKPRDAEILWTFIDVEPLPFNRGFFTVDIKFFIKVRVDVFIGIGRPQTIEGLATFDKRIILFGSEGEAKIFSSNFVPMDPDLQNNMKTNLPKAIVEVVDPILLDAKVVEECEKNTGCCNMDVSSVPTCICGCFTSPLVDPDDSKRLFVTLGIFSIVKLARKVQIIVPSFDFCIPENECCEIGSEDACSLFNRMDFPINEFFPPKLSDTDFESPCDTPTCAGTNRASDERRNDDRRNDDRTHENHNGDRKR